jgi:hypothetical protein
MYSYMFHIVEYYFCCICFILYKQHYGLSRERLHMARLDDYNILQPEQLVENRLGGTHDSINVHNLRLHSFACGSSHVMCRAIKEHLTCGNLRKIRVSRATR